MVFLQLLQPCYPSSECGEHREPSLACPVWYFLVSRVLSTYTCLSCRPTCCKELHLLFLEVLSTSSSRQVKMSASSVAETTLTSCGLESCSSGESQARASSTLILSQPYRRSDQSSVRVDISKSKWKTKGPKMHAHWVMERVHSVCPPYLSERLLSLPHMGSSS